MNLNGHKDVVTPSRSLVDGAIKAACRYQTETETDRMDKRILMENFEVPSGACDTHFHVFAPPGRYPYAQRRPYTPPEASLEQYLALASKIGIERMIFVQPSVYGTDNSCMLEALSTVYSKARAVAVVPFDVSTEEITRLHEHGVRGVRLNLASFGEDRPESGLLSRVERLSEKIQGLGWHLQLFAAPSLLFELMPFITGLPLPIVIDHMGFVPAGDPHPAFKQLISSLASPNLWVKLSGAYRLSDTPPLYEDVTPMARDLIEAAPDRVLWGSDWPHTGSHRRDGHPPSGITAFRNLDTGALLKLLALWAPDTTSVHKILVDNPTRLYFFD